MEGWKLIAIFSYFVSSGVTVFEPTILALSWIESERSDDALSRSSRYPERF